MELLQLRYFRAVARHEHVGRAAAELDVAQPSVSRAVIRLETEVGAPLFDRVGRRIRLNPTGARFLASVDRALDTLDDGLRELDDSLSADLGSVSVAAETLLPMTRLAAAFRERHPAAGLSLRQASAPRMAELLTEGDVDLCLASQPLDLPGARRTLLDEEEVLVAMPAGHALARHVTVPPHELLSAGQVVPPDGYWQRALLDAVADEAGRGPMVACETAEPAATLELVRAGLGVTLLPRVARASTDPTGIEWRPLGSALAVRRLELVWREDAYLSRTAQAFSTLAVAHWAAADGAQGRSGSRGRRKVRS